MAFLELFLERQLSSCARFPAWLNKSFCWLTLSFPVLWFLTDGRVDLLLKLIVLGFLFVFVTRKEVRQDGLVLLALSLIVFLAWEYVWQLYAIPQDLLGGRFPTKYVSFFCFFIPVAYSTVLWRRISPYVILLGAALGLLIFLAAYAPLTDWQQAWQGQRVDFGFRNAQHAGVFFGAGLLAACFFGYRLLRAATGLKRVFAASFIFVFTTVMLYGAIVTQVRAVWIALLLAFFTGLLAFFMTGNFRHILAWFKCRRRLTIVFLMLLGLGALINILGVQDRIEKRILQENISVGSVQEAIHFESEAMTSSSVRIALWTAAIDWIENRPLLGWGMHSAEHLIGKDDRFSPEFKQSFGHLHNSYLEAWVAIGAIGICWVSVMIVWIARSVICAWRRGAMPTDAFLFSWAFFVFWAAVNCFESYINYASGFYLTTIIIGFLYAFHLQQPSDSVL